MGDIEERYRIENAIKQQQNRITDSHKQVRELEVKADEYARELGSFNQVKDDHDRFMYDYMTDTNNLIELASSFNFIKQYESRREALLNSPSQKRATEELFNRETMIRKSMTDTEEDIYLEKKRACVLEDQLDSLEHELSRLLQTEQ